MRIRETPLAALTPVLLLDEQRLGTIVSADLRIDGLIRYGVRTEDNHYRPLLTADKDFMVDTVMLEERRELEVLGKTAYVRDGAPGSNLVNVGYQRPAAQIVSFFPDKKKVEQGGEVSEDDLRLSLFFPGTDLMKMQHPFKLSDVDVVQPFEQKVLRPAAERVAF